MQDKKKNKLSIPIEEEIAKEAMPIVEKIISHLREIVIAVGVVVVIAAGYSGYKWYTQNKLNNIKKQLGSILLLKEDNEKISKLNKLLKEAPSQAKQAIRLHLAKLYIKTKQYDKAVSMFEKVAENSDDLNVKVIAKIGKANCFKLMGKKTEALKILVKLKDNQEYAQIVTMEIAKLAEDTQNINQALWAYKKLKSNLGVSDPNGLFYQYKIAQLEQELQNQTKGK